MWKEQEGWQTMNTLCRLKESAERTIQPFCQGRGITPVQLRILLCLYFDGGQTVGELAGKTGMAGTNNSAQCKRLAAMGYLDRQRDEHDERRVQVRLSADGQNLIDAFLREKGDIYIDIFQQCSGEDRQLFNCAFSRLAQLMDNNTNQGRGQENG